MGNLFAKPTWSLDKISYNHNVIKVKSDISLVPRLLQGRGKEPGTDRSGYEANLICETLS